NLAGASGAIWGLMAALPTWLMLNRAYLPQRLVSDWMRQLISVIIINAVISFIPGISKEAHFGGGAVGAVVGVLLNLHRFGRDSSRWVYTVLIALVPVACIGLVVRAREHWPAQIRHEAEREESRLPSWEDEEIQDFQKTVTEPLRLARRRSDQ